MSQALATQERPAAPAVANSAAKRDIRDFFQTNAVAEQLKMALPRFLTPDRMIRIFITQINGDEKLQSCSIESLLSSLMKAAQMGLEPDGRHGHLISRWNSKKNCQECSFQADYKGLVSLVRKNPGVQDVYAELVYENDKFVLTKGLHRDLTHEVDIRADRGELIGAYAVILYVTGYPGFEFMSRGELFAIRERSDGWKAYKANKISSTPWGTDEGEMCKKTVLKRLLKLADLDPDTTQRLTLDVESEATRIEQPQFDGPAQQQLTGNAGALPAPSGESAAVTQPAAVTAPTTTQTEKPARKSRLPVRPPAETATAAAPTAGTKAAETQEQSPFGDEGAQQALPKQPPAEEKQPDTASGKVRALLAKGGYAVAEFIALAAANGWCDAEAKDIDALTEAQLATFLEEWESVVEEIDNVRKKAK